MSESNSKRTAPVHDGFVWAGTVARMRRGGKSSRTGRRSALLSVLTSVYANSARSGELASYIRGLSSEVARRRLETRALFTTNFIASQVTFFLLTGIIVFAIPMLTSADRPTVIKITASILFLIGPISGVVGGLPVLQRVNAAAEAILSVQARLSEMSREPPALGRLPHPSFMRLTLHAATFSYDGPPDELGFQVGPIDLQVDRGAIGDWLLRRRADAPMEHDRHGQSQDFTASHATSP